MKKAEMIKAVVCAALVCSVLTGGKATAAQMTTDCILVGKDIMQNGKKIGRYDGKYIVRVPEFIGAGRRDGAYVIRLPDKKDVCRLDGKNVVNMTTGKKIGTGDAAIVCLCAGLLD